MRQEARPEGTVPYVGCGMRETKGREVEVSTKSRVTEEISKIFVVLRTLLVY